MCAARPVTTLEASEVRIMAAGSRRWLHGLITSGVATALASTVNLATEWKTNWLAWLGVVVLTVVGFLLGAFLISPAARPLTEQAGAVVEERTTKRWWRQSVDSTRVEGAVLVEDRWPDGRTRIRVFDKDVAGSYLELRSFEVSRETET
jgi:hypothetical protein